MGRHRHPFDGSAPTEDYSWADVGTPLENTNNAAPTPSNAPAEEDQSWSDWLAGAALTASRQAGQGASFGFLDEPTDALLAGATSLATGVPYDQMYDEARDITKRDLKNDWQEHPFLSAGGNVAGGVLTGKAGADLLSKGLPAVSSTIKNAATLYPKTAAFLTGAGGGGLYAAGQAEGNLSDRADDALTGAAYGGPLGVGGYWAAKGASNLGSMISPMLKKSPAVAADVGGILDDPIQQAVAQTDDILAPAVSQSAKMADDAITPMKLAGILDETALAQTQQGNVLPLTRGNKTQNVNIQRMEQIAAESGSKPMLEARALQQTAARKPFENILGADVPVDPIDLRNMEQGFAESAATGVRKSFDSLKNQENAAWKTARESGLVGIKNDNIYNYAVKVRSSLDEKGIPLEKFSALKNHLGELDTMIEKANTQGFNSSSLKDLDNWRKQLYNLQTAGQGINERSAQKALGDAYHEFDSFLTNLADDAIVDGDQTAIQAFKEARNISKQRFQFYEGDKAIARILDNRDLSGEQLVNLIFGAEKLAGKGDNGRLIETMLSHAGDRAPEMQEALKRGIMAKSFRRALTTTADPADVSKNLLSFDKMRNEIGNIINKKEILQSVFSEPEQAYVKQLYTDLKLISSAQKGALNPSGTGMWTADFISGMGKVLNNPLFRMTPGVGMATTGLDSLLQKQAAGIVTGKVEQSLGDILPSMINQIDAPAAFYGSIGANAIGPDGVVSVIFQPDDEGDQ